MSDPSPNMRRMIRASRLLAELGHADDTLAALEELKAARADALRYRKWRADYTGTEATEMLINLADAYDAVDVDAAIDAAMAAEAKA